MRLNLAVMGRKKRGIRSMVFWHFAAKPVCVKLHEILQKSLEAGSIKETLKSGSNCFRNEIDVKIVERDWPFFSSHNPMAKSC